MSVTIEPSQTLLDATARRAHAQCCACAQEAESGLRLCFRLQPDHVVEAVHQAQPRLQGYDGILHGGVIAALADAAMTNALFARGVVALTVRLDVRYRLPVRVALPVVVRGWLVSSRPPLFNLAAELRQNGLRMARVSAVFMENPQQAPRARADAGVCLGAE